MTLFATRTVAEMASQMISSVAISYTVRSRDTQPQPHLDNARFLDVLAFVLLNNPCCMNFELHNSLHSPQNMHLKALLYLKRDKSCISFLSNTPYFEMLVK